MPGIKNNKIKYIQSKLTEWVKLNKRSFPWRNTDAGEYEVLVAEIMLRRTTAKVANSVFPIFIRQYPDFESLAKADIDTLIRIIKPLGKYNLKSKLFLDLAEKASPASSVDLNVDTLATINGLGPYTINAFLCFAKKERLPIVDSNVIRLYSRYFGVESNYSNRKNAEIINNIANNCLPKIKFHEYNTALLDFGAMVCKPMNPDCNACPLKSRCCHIRIGCK